MKTFRSTLFVVLLGIASGSWGQAVRKPIQDHLHSLAKQIDQIPDGKRTQLDQLAFAIHKTYDQNDVHQLVFIEEENGPVSLLTELWLDTALLYYNVPGIRVQSGGNQIHPNPIPALEDLDEYGFKVKTKKGNPPVYKINYGNGSLNFTSKKLTDLELTATPTVKVYLEQLPSISKATPKAILLSESKADIPLHMVYLAARLKHLMTTSK